MSATDDYLAQLQRMIDQHGWAVSGTVKPTGLGGLVGIFYTVGLTLRGLPELTFGGTNPPVAKGILNLIGARAVQDGLVPGTTYRLDRVPPFTVEDMPPARAKQRLVMAWNLYGDAMTAQLVKIRLDGPGEARADG